jgi:hypothetical protein
VGRQHPRCGPAIKRAKVTSQLMNGWESSVVGQFTSLPNLNLLGAVFPVEG